MKGRRVNSIEEITEPGDYFGPTSDYTGKIPAIFFLKPNARDTDAPIPARAIQHVCAPPHTFTEEADGTLTISPSISEYKSSDTQQKQSDGWHGYLEHGIWRKV